MSRVRGVFPLFLATAFGIVNGVYVFGPSFKEQVEQKNGKPLEIANGANDEEVNEIRKAEAEASRIVSTESALSNKGSSISWWPSMSLWATDSSSKGNANIITAAATPASASSTQEEAHKQRKEEK